MIKGVVFDMDGLMFDTERLSRDAWIYAGEQIGRDITEEICAITTGLNAEDTKKAFMSYFGEDFDFSTARNIKLDYMFKNIEDKGMPVKTGLPELLEYIEQNHYKVTVATSSDRKRAEYYFEKANISKYFNEIVCGDMIKHGKPAPDIYIKACEILGLEPSECIALEDSLLGIISAHSAGLAAVMIPDLIQPNENIDKLLYAKVPTLLGVPDLLTK